VVVRAEGSALGLDACCAKIDKVMLMFTGHDGSPCAGVMAMTGEI
jgi:hypothetical protein